jgi:hypothetical protein
MTKCILLVALLALVAFASALNGAVSNPCLTPANSADCQAASTNRVCCLWCLTQSGVVGNGGVCVNGFIDNTSGFVKECRSQQQTIANPSSYADGDFKCKFGFAGTCRQTVSCPGEIPDISGVWFYPPDCPTYTKIGGQFQITSTSSNGAFSIGATKNQELRIPPFTGAVDVNGNFVMVANSTGLTCSGTASVRELQFSCQGANCVQRAFRSSAAAVVVSALVLALCVILALF